MTKNTDIDKHKKKKKKSMMSRKKKALPSRIQLQFKALVCVGDQVHLVHEHVHGLSKTSLSVFQSNTQTQWFIMFRLKCFLFCFYLLSAKLR